MADKKEIFTTKKITMLGIFAAMCYAVTFFSHLTPAIFLPYLHLDFKDVLIVICGFIVGPIEAIAVTVVTSLIEMVTFSSTGLFGFLMNVISSCAFAVTASLIYRRNRKMSTAIASLICGVIMQTGVMLFWNYIIVPIYTPGMTRAQVVPYLIPAFLPFNAIKGFLNMALTLLIYRPVKKALAKTNLIPHPENPTGVRFECIFFSVLIIITCTLILLIEEGVI